MTGPGSPAEEHPRHGLDEVIHAPVRFSVMATLASAEEAEFGFVRDGVQVSDSLLSKTVSALEKAGYVEVRKGYVGKRPRTWLRLSRRGREAFGAHVAALRAIADGALPPAVTERGHRPGAAAGVRGRRG